MPPPRHASAQGTLYTSSSPGGLAGPSARPVVLKGHIDPYAPPVVLGHRILEGAEGTCGYRFLVEVLEKVLIRRHFIVVELGQKRRSCPSRAPSDESPSRSGRPAPLAQEPRRSELGPGSSPVGGHQNCPAAASRCRMAANTEREGQPGAVWLGSQSCRVWAPPTNHPRSSERASYRPVVQEVK
jgi:hypothetical protein